MTKSTDSSDTTQSYSTHTIQPSIYGFSESFFSKTQSIVQHVTLWSHKHKDEMRGLVAGCASTVVAVTGAGAGSAGAAIRRIGG